MADKPIVQICSWCQKINSPENAQYANSIDHKIRDELKVVDQQIKANTDKFSFTHGACIPHLIQSYKAIGMTDDQLKPIIKKTEMRNPPECLITNEAVRHAFMKGLFTPELVKQQNDALQQSNNQIKERFQVLSGLKNLYDR